MPTEEKKKASRKDQEQEQSEIIGSEGGGEGTAKGDLAGTREDEGEPNEGLLQKKGYPPGSES